MFDKDSEIIFEAYRTIVEAPIDPGGSWDMPSGDVADKFAGMVSKRNKKTLDELLTQYSVVDRVNRINIIDLAKQYLDSQGSHSDMSQKDFADSFAEILKPKSKEWGFKSFRAPHISRVIITAVIELDVMTKDGQIQDTSKLDDEEEVLDTPVEPVKGDVKKPDITSKTFDLKARYVVDPLGAIDLSSDEREMTDYIPEEGAEGDEILYLLLNTIKWREANERESERVSKLKLQALLGTWVKRGILINKGKEEEEKFGGKHIETDEPTGSAQHAAGDYLSSQGIDVPQADIWSGGYDEY